MTIKAKMMKIFQRMIMKMQIHKLLKIQIIHQPIKIMKKILKKKTHHKNQNRQIMVINKQLMMEYLEKIKIRQKVLKIKKKKRKEAF